MLDWLRKLASGDQGAVPSGGKVERDKLGRVGRIRQTIPSATNRLDGGDFPALAPHPELGPAIASACCWLADCNIALAREYGVGLEDAFDFTQNRGELVLFFAGGHVLRFRAQVLGSFNPRDRSFAWGWANPSIAPELYRDISVFRDTWQQQPALTTAVQEVAFDSLTRLLALAARSMGADGVYRCTGDDVSLFLAVWTEEVPAPMVVAARDDASPALLEAACTLVSAYDADMLVLDQAYAARAEQDEPSETDDLIGRKLDVYRHYWVRDDDFWKPSSLGWPSEHDPVQQRVRFAAFCIGGGVICVTVLRDAGRSVHHLKEIEGQFKIVDQLIHWGGGFIWPRAQSLTSDA